MECYEGKKHKVRFNYGLTLFTLGNAMMHISGAMATARASEGRLSVITNGISAIAGVIWFITTLIHTSNFAYFIWKRF